MGPRPRTQGCGTLASLADFDMGCPELYTASVVLDGPGSHTHAFAALLAVDEQQVRERLRDRLGTGAEQAIVRRGFDPSDPLAASLLSEAVANALADVTADARSPLGDGLDVFVFAEQRFTA